jgi:hypothetical protein
MWMIGVVIIAVIAACVVAIFFAGRSEDSARG